MGCRMPWRVWFIRRADGSQTSRAGLTFACFVLGCFFLAAVWGCTDWRVPSFASAPSLVRGWVSSADGAAQLLPVERVLQEATSAPATLVIDPTRRYQTMTGFGAAITDASAWLLQSRMDAKQRAALIQELFGPAPGIGISLVRLPIGASDFSTHAYSLDDVPAGQIDPQLEHFSLEPLTQAVLPVLHAALAKNPSLRVIASPWSAPAWMKSNDALLHGTLLPKYYGAFAAYLVRYVDQMRAQGVPIFALTLQNEPHFDPENYPGMLLPPAARAELIGRHLGPALAPRRPATLILDWDHNWSWPQEPLAVLGDPIAARYTAGVAWHCYDGKPSAQTPVHDAHPDKSAYLTECSGGDWQRASDPPLVRMTRDLIIEATRNWASGVLLWNLALDESRGPHLGGCGTCRGLLTIDSTTGEVTRNPDYYVIAHASRFVRPGAQRIESTETSDGLANVAFRNRDDGSIVLIVANSTPEARPMLIRCGDREFQATLAGQSIATFVWQRV